MNFLEDQSSTLVKRSYIKQGLEGLKSRHKLLTSLLSERRLPKDGWDDLMIEYVLHELAMMDSNNFVSNIGVGEREGRVFSTLVSKRHYGLHHGIGRSGDISEAQPKAAGSSLLSKLTTCLVCHALKISGLDAVKNCLVVPVATGMSLALTLLSMKKAKPNAKYVIWSRIDQKSCFKAISLAGFSPLIVDNVIDRSDSARCDQVCTNIPRIKELMEEYGDEVLCVLTTTSCFAPRRPDKVDEVAVLCKNHDIGHVINNAYGLQCSFISKLINRACVKGRVDVVIQSTDKNFMVPVGGAIIASTDKSLLEQISKSYPGRASIDPILDLFITLLSMGENGYRHLLTYREKTLLPLLQGKLATVASKHGEYVLKAPENKISLAMSLVHLQDNVVMDCNVLGSRLFHSCVSGTRVVVSTPPNPKGGSSSVATQGASSSDVAVENADATVAIENVLHMDMAGTLELEDETEDPVLTVITPKPTIINGYQFYGWGGHIDTTVTPMAPYMNAACSIGMSERDVEMFEQRLDRELTKMYKSNK